MRGRPAAGKSPQIIDDELSTPEPSPLSETVYEPAPKRSRVAPFSEVVVEIPNTRYVLSTCQNPWGLC